MRAGRDSGFTMIEVMVTVLLATTLMSFAVSGWSTWSKAQAHEGGAVAIQSVLRNAQQRAVTEGRSLCVSFDDAADTYRVLEGRCGTTGGAVLQGPWALDDGVSLTAPGFATDGGTLVAGASFTSRGTASPGSVKVRRAGTGTTYEVRVEGLTGRVSIH